MSQSTLFFASVGNFVRKVSSERLWSRLAHEESGLVIIDGTAYLGCTPRHSLHLPPSFDAWDQLKAFVTEAEHPVMASIGYEMGAYADPRYPLPHFPPPYPALSCYEFTECLSCPQLLSPSPSCPLLALHTTSDHKAGYLKKITAIRHEIEAGNVYQVNLSQSFTYSHDSLDPLPLFQAIYRRNPAAYSAYMHAGTHTLLSFSPELFVRRIQGQLMTRPIKGTAARGKTAEEDQRLRHALACSAKDRAELLMITDLMRNDLAQVCDRGSVRVTQLSTLETHTDVFHLVSTLTGASRRHPVDIVRTLFPAGSVTGCPKKAAIECIAHSEQRPRGIYTGAMGLFFPNGDFSLNVAIRTLAMDANTLTVQLGGAILYDSDPEAEYQETLCKGKTFFDVLAQGVGPC